MVTSKDYTLSLVASLPKDRLWGREKTETESRFLSEAQPDVLFQKALGTLFEITGFTDNRMVLGLLLNMINILPAEYRLSLADGIIHGAGLQFEFDEGKMVLAFDQYFTDIENHDEEEVTPGGLIVPKSGLILPDGVSV